MWSESLQRRRDELISVILKETPDAIGELTDTTSLLRSGLVDSVRLLDIALFVEREIDRAVDYSAMDLERDWDTIEAILSYIDRSRLSSGSERENS